jgi:outer membrane protein
MIRKVFVLFLLAGPFAQAAEEPILDLKSVISKGLTFSPDVQKATSLMRSADDNFRLAESKLFPTINAQGITNTSRNTVTYNPATSASLQNSLYTESYTAQLMLSQPILKGGALSAGISYAKVARDIAQQSFFKAKQDYLLQLMNAYFTAAQNDQMMAMAHENRDILKGYFEITKKYVTIGRNKGIDRMQAEANFILAEAEILRIETLWETGIQDLLRLTGDTSIKDRKIQSHFDTQPVIMNNLEESSQKALENNPDLQIARLNKEQQNYQNELNLVNDRPSLSLTGAMGYISPDRPHLFNQTSEAYSVGFTLTIPLFSGLSSLSQKRANTESSYQFEKDQQTAQLTVRQSLAVAMTTLTRNFDQLKLTRAAAESARRAMDEALKEYRQGMITSTDVVTLQTTRYTAETQFLAAQFSYLKQIVSLRHDLGVDLEKVYAQ